MSKLTKSATATNDNFLRSVPILPCSLSCIDWEERNICALSKDNELTSHARVTVYCLSRRPMTLENWKHALSYRALSLA
jgi:hypothetical protein